MPDLKLKKRDILILKALMKVEQLEFALLKRLLKNRVKFGDGCRISPKTFFYKGTGEIEFGRDAIIDRGIHPVSFDLDEGSSVRIGDSCWFQSDVSPMRFSTKPGARIVIGNRCWFSGGLYGASRGIIVGDHTLIAWGCNIMDSDMHAIDNDATPKTAPIVIGSHVWIAHGVTILPGAKIGDHCVIGSGSLVSGEIPPNSFAVGRPARVIRTIGDRDKLDIFSRP